MTKFRKYIPLILGGEDNLVDESTMVNGYYSGSSFIVSSAYKTTDYINVSGFSKPTVFTLKWTDSAPTHTVKVITFGSSKNYLGDWTTINPYTDVDGNNRTTFVLEPDAYYIRLTITGYGETTNLGLYKYYEYSSRDNLVDYSTLSVGMYNNDGTYNSNSSFLSTDKIPVSEGYYVVDWVRYSTSTLPVRVSAFDSNMDFISNTYIGENPKESAIYSIYDTQTKYIVISWNKTVNRVYKAYKKEGNILPNGYRQLVGVERNKVTDGKIDTGICPSVDNVEIYIKSVPAFGMYNVLQSKASASGPIFGIGGNQVDSHLYIEYYTSNKFIQSDIERSFGLYKQELRATQLNGNAKLYVRDFYLDAEATNTTTYTFVAPTSNLYLYGNSVELENGGGTIYACYVKVGGYYRMNYVPAEYNGQIGFYDLVSETFKTCPGLFEKTE